MDSPQLIPTSPYTRANRWSTRCVRLHQVWRRRRLQQSAHQRWSPTQGRIQDEIRTVWAHGHVFRALQLPRNFPEHDEPHISAAQRQMGKARGKNYRLYGRHIDSYVHITPRPQRRDTWRIRPSAGTQSIPQKEEMPLGSRQHQLSGANPWKGGDTHGPNQSGGYQKLAHTHKS